MLVLTVFSLLTPSNRDGHSIAAGGWPPLSWQWCRLDYLLRTCFPACPQALKECSERGPRKERARDKRAECWQHWTGAVMQGTSGSADEAGVLRAACEEVQSVCTEGGAGGLLAMFKASKQFQAFQSVNEQVRMRTVSDN